MVTPIGVVFLIMWRTSVLTIWHNDSKSGERMCGHSSIHTTERYLGSEQEIEIAVNDNLGL